MQAQEIEHYLAELGAALESQGISKPVRLLLIGGAYMMLLANAPRTTDMIKLSCRGANYGNGMGRCTCMPSPRSTY
jgi:hypothetical protein